MTRLSLTRPLFDNHEQGSTNCPKFLEQPFPNSRLQNCDMKRVLRTYNFGVMREFRGVLSRILPSTCELIHFVWKKKTGTMLQKLGAIVQNLDQDLYTPAHEYHFLLSMSMVVQKAHCLFLEHLDSEVHLLCKHTVELQNTRTEAPVCVVFQKFYAELQTPFK